MLNEKQFCVAFKNVIVQWGLKIRQGCVRIQKTSNKYRFCFRKGTDHSLKTTESVERAENILNDTRTRQEYLFSPLQ